VISAESEELLELAKMMIMAHQSPMGACAFIKKDDFNNRVVIINDKYLEQIGESGILDKEGETPVDKYINAHIIKWGIKPKKPVKPKKESKKKKKQEGHKIKVE
jgi:hypothetical protein